MVDTSFFWSLRPIADLLGGFAILFVAVLSVVIFFGLAIAYDKLRQYRCKHPSTYENTDTHHICMLCGKDLGPARPVATRSKKT